MIALNTQAVRSLDDFEADMETLIAELKDTPRRPDVPEIYYPGEMEALTEAKNLSDGISLPEDTAKELKHEARGLGVIAPF